MKSSSALALILFCLLSSCTSTDRDIRIAQEQPEYTVLTLKNYNNLLEITLLSTDGGQQKSILLFSNPSTKKGRHHITVKARLDNGATWPEKYWLMLDEGTGNGYSCLTCVDNDHIGILYESSQADMVFQKIKIKEILE